ncbi:MAG: DUF945 family protein [Halopseudomonas sp.]
MKKALAIAGIGLVAAAGFSSYMGRTLSQQAFDVQVEELRKLAPLYLLTLEDAELKQGLFSGEARVSLFFEPPTADQPPMFFVVESALQYGPLMMTDDGIKLGLVAGKSHLTVKGLSESAAEQLEALIGPHLLSATHLVDFNQQLVAELQVPAFDITEEQQRVSFAGVQAQIRSDMTTHTAEGDITIGSLTISVPEGNMDIATSQAQFASSDITDYMAPGQFTLNFPEINVTQPGITSTLQNLAIAVEQTVDDGMINITETLSIANIISPLPVTAASATFEFERLNPKGVELWTEMAAQLGSLDNDAGLPDISSEQTREMVGALLQQGLQFNQRYQLEALDGTLNADLDIEYLGLPDGLHPMDITDPSQFLSAIKAELKFETDQQVMSILPIGPAVPQYVEQGLLLEEEQKLRMTATLVNGELTVNDLPFPLEGLLPAELAKN